MSLDQNLFTLNVVPDATNPVFTDLVDPSGEAHYKKERLSEPPYRMNVYDPHSAALLASATAPEASSKTKIIELYNPPLAIELRSIGTISFKWSFRWEDHEFEWKRENCFMVRKPDPDVLVAVTKEPPGRLRTSAVQILDYNLNRFDINDRKGLEIVILTALLTFHDLNAAFNSVPPPPYTALPPASSPAPVPPTPPPKPEPKTGMNRIAEIQAARGEINEVTVVDEGSVEDYAAYGAQLLADDAMLFISVRSDAAEQVPKVLAVVEELKRQRHKAGLPDDGLHQYVVYDVKQPKRINLDDPPAGPSKDYKPPDSLMIHLSKIDMPELKPRPNLDRQATRAAAKQRTPPATPKEPASQPAASSTPSLSSRLLKSRRSPSQPSTPVANPPAPHAPHGSSRPPMPLPASRPSPPSGRPAPSPSSRPGPSSSSAPSSSRPSVSPRPGHRPSPSQLNNPIVYVGEPAKRTSFWKR